MNKCKIVCKNEGEEREIVLEFESDENNAISVNVNIVPAITDPENENLGLAGVVINDYLEFITGSGGNSNEVDVEEVTE